ncbi:MULTISPECIES: branched-chain amino acid ABC transporter permease [unclassified Bradyrhizobium]|uniref:branched-chain amino acid ABC transporter permease n=1 Tax=unclassified Bradyrhizobium TaxID=2631580 RepID=UPI00247A8238|nr:MULTISPECIES: branched-chain amino acid ABC transporter permease [unclassified Bradyrhizobium]WGR73124.1 branched-chain amino acid ABC transporter permease [Bradyrhizobium sp. ISRA426]WGR77964.1 branched-chain amino acid ABC transporter permease [Bradyrhizobium sp. ISRA430]WGR88365.1 branched-chain amino acid ABC transporter permease [Bradyrhizobium sp. ISRA432]
MNKAFSALAYGWVVACCALVALLPLFIGDYHLSFAINALSYIVMATAWGLFCGPTRYISLASAALYGIGAYTVAVLGESMSWPIVLLVAAAIGGGLSLLIGMATLRLAGVYFVIFTFGVTELVRQLVNWYEIKVTHSVGRYVFLETSQSQIFWQLLAMVGIIFTVGIALNRSRVGFALRLIGGDQVMAGHFGVNTTRTKLALFVASSVFITLTGAVMAPRWTYVDPTIAFNSAVSFQILIMALLGGTQSLFGPLIGVIPMTILFELLGTKFPNHYTLLIGIIFMIIVYLLPDGIYGFVARRGRLLLARLMPRSELEAVR